MKDYLEKSICLIDKKIYAWYIIRYRQSVGDMLLTGINRIIYENC